MTDLTDLKNITRLAPLNKKVLLGEYNISFAATHIIYAFEDDLEFEGKEGLAISDYRPFVGGSSACWRLDDK